MKKIQFFFTYETECKAKFYVHSMHGFVLHLKRKSQKNVFCLTQKQRYNHLL